MFKIFNSIKSKAVASTGSNPMADIVQARVSTQDRDESRLKQADLFYQEALDLIDQFRISNYENSLLLKAAEKLEESLKFNRNKGESNFWLAYILYNFNQVKGAWAYLKKAESLTPDYPQIKMLKDIISN